eukprot:scaffold17444_cov85-Skeletonema_dohrnii-CCMP3373.AAC.2
MDTDTDTGEFLEVSRYATSKRMKVHNVTTILYQPQPAIAIEQKGSRKGRAEAEICSVSRAKLSKRTTPAIPTWSDSA